MYGHATSCSPSSATRSEPRAPRVGRNGRPATEARSPETKRSSLYSKARISPRGDGPPERGREPELLEADVPGVHLGDGAAGDEQLDVERGEERVEAEAAPARVGERRQERDRLPPQEHAADAEPRPVGHELRGLVEPDQLWRPRRTFSTKRSAVRLFSGTGKRRRNVSEFEVFRIERSDAVAVVWINRPEKKNAMSPTFFRELPLVLDELGADEACARRPHRRGRRVLRRRRHRVVPGSSTGTPPGGTSGSSSTRSTRSSGPSCR